MFQLTYLLLTQLAMAEQPTLSPIKAIGPKSLPPKLALDGSSPVLEEQRRQREEAEEEAAAEEANASSNNPSGNNSSGSAGEIRSPTWVQCRQTTLLKWRCNSRIQFFRKGLN